MIMLLAFIGLAVPLSVAAAQTSATLSRSSGIFNDRLDRFHCADAGVQHAMWRILYEPGFAASLTDWVSFPYTVTQCGISVPVTITKIQTQEAIRTTYTVPAGHVIEMKLIVEDESDDDMWFAYDTVDEPSWLYIPSPIDGDMTLYLHNNPTPPTADTDAQHPLPMDTTQGTATTLYNYDEDIDGEAGLFLPKSEERSSESDPTKYQEWRTASLASNYNIDGIIQGGLWFGMKDFSTDKTGIYRIYIRDCLGSSCTDLGFWEMTATPEMLAGGFVASLTEIYDISASVQGSSTQVRVNLVDGNLLVISTQIQ